MISSTKIGDIILFVVNTKPRDKGMPENKMLPFWLAVLFAYPTNVSHRL